MIVSLKWVLRRQNLHCKTKCLLFFYLSLKFKASAKVAICNVAVTAGELEKNGEREKMGKSCAQEESVRCQMLFATK